MGEDFFKKRKETGIEDVILEILVLLLYGHKLEVETQRQRPAKEMCLVLLPAPALWALQVPRPGALFGGSRCLQCGEGAPLRAVRTRDHITHTVSVCV